MESSAAKLWKSVFLIGLLLVMGFLVVFVFTETTLPITRVLIALLYFAYFIYILKRPAPDVLWSIISLPLGFFIFYKAAGFSLSLTALLSVGLAFLTLILLPWIVYRG